ncbi:MAG TPA: C-type lectin domain-containing protein [Polyangiaceae bacterium]
MSRRASAGFERLKAALIAGAFALQGCPLSDDYYIDEDMAGGSGGAIATGGSSTGGKTTAPPDCREESFEMKKYLFCTADRPYPMAETTCANAGMTLVLIDDENEDEWVWTTLDRRYGGVQPFAFIGANDREQEGEWFFADGVQFWSGAEDGERVGERYVQWGPGQPNDLSPVTLTQEDCGSITLADGTWNDARCELACPFVCEAK